VTNKSIRNGNVTAKELAGMRAIHAQTQFTDPTASDGNFTSGEAVAHCPPGWRVLTGSGSTGGNRVALQASAPNATDTWLAIAASDNGSTAAVVATAYCLPPSPAPPFKLP
jgi:hypothetical protein